MRTHTTERGFRAILHPRYVPPHDEIRLIGESSAIRDYEDAFDSPGSSCLWVGADLHLDREEVAELIALMQAWLAEKRLPGPQEEGR